MKKYTLTGPNSSFSISMNGTWPTEGYSIVPNDYNNFNTKYTFVSAIIGQNMVRFVNNSTNDIDFIIRPNPNGFNIVPFQYGSSKYQIQTAYNSFQFYNPNNVVSDTFNWNYSAMRSYNIGPLFNYMYMDFSKTWFVKSTAIPMSALGLDIRSYLLYPQRLFLKPISATKNNDGTFSLVTSSVLLAPTAIYINSLTAEQQAFLTHQSLLTQAPSCISLYANGANVYLTYNISAVKNVVNNPIYTFNPLDPSHPIQLQDVLEPSYAAIRPDSTFINFNTYVQDFQVHTGSLSLIGQDYVDETPNMNKGFRTSFLENYNYIQNKNVQTFQLIQSGINIDPNIPLESTLNCILSVVVNLANSTYLHNSYYIQDGFQLISPLIGIPEKPLQYRYIVDSPYFFNDSTIPVASTTTQVLQVSTSNRSVAYPLNSAVNFGSYRNDKITWNLNYPIHYYAYKVGFTNAPNFTSPSEVTNLTFNLSTWITNQSLSSVYLSSCLVSDYNILKLDLPTYAPNEFISLKVVDKYRNRGGYPVLLQYLSCYYGNNLQYTYDLVNSPYIPVSSLSGFQIYSNPTLFGEFSYLFRTSLSSQSIGHVTDSPNAFQITFSPGAVQANKGYPIFINSDESSNAIKLDVSYLTAYPLYPARNLTNTLISWSLTDNDPLSSNISIYSDYDGSLIPLNSAVSFQNTTWTIWVTGYGPSQAIISLSSQAYNEVATVSTNPSFFNYYKENKILVGPTSITTPNISTVALTLTAGVHVDGLYYSLPPTSSLHWSWTYDDQANVNTDPISVYYSNNNSRYSYGRCDIGSNLSAIKAFIPVNSALDPFQVHNIKFFIKTEFPQTVTGEYDINVYDYPNSGLFNCDFTVANYSYPQTPVVDTRSNNNNKILTRLNTDLNNYQFTSYTDSLPSVSAKLFQWIITDNVGTYRQVSSTNFFDISSINHQIISNATTTTVTLCVVNGIIQGWNTAGTKMLPQTIQKSIQINTVPYSAFNVPVSFIVYPPYTWLAGNSGYLTVLDQSNYTLACAPTAYDNKISLSQSFYLSANVIANEYEYSYGINKTLVNPAYSAISLVEFPYITDFYSATGAIIQLSAWNNLFPRNNGNYYFSVDGNNQPYTSYFNITSQTLPFTKKTSGSNAFRQSPVIVPYDDFSLDFQAVDTTYLFDSKTVTQYVVNYVPVTSIDLDQNVYVGIYQTITSPNSSNTPIKVVSDLSKTIYYTISTDSWVGYRQVPLQNGYFNLFSLYIGDASQPFTVSPYAEYNTIYIGASTTYLLSLSSSTFKNYPNVKDKNLWNSVVKSAVSPVKSLLFYLTAVQPEIYISSYYNLTGENINIQFQTPASSKNLQITSYNIDFGDGNIEYHSINDIIIHSYTSEGTYILNYTVNYSNGLNESYAMTQYPINILSKWPVYDQSKIRLLTESALTLPWTLDEIQIQPNEFGVSDIFNNTISRLYDCLDYLNNNIQTINTNAPTIFYGWLGTHASDLYTGPEWHTQNYKSVYYNEPNKSTSLGSTSFKSLSAVVESEDKLFLLDGSELRVFINGRKPKEIFFDNYYQIKNLIPNPVSIDVDTVRNNMYVVDNIKNKIYKLNLSFDYINEINVQLVVGGYGSKNDPNKFFAPSEVKYIDNNVYVLDYNNFCLKQYTQDLNWLRTYYNNDFQTYRPIFFTIHPTTLFVYIMTENHQIYTFDEMGNFINSFPLNDVINNLYYSANSVNVGYIINPVVKIFFDENGDFFYVVSKDNIFKYALDGTFISIVNIPYGSIINPKGAVLSYTSGNFTSRRSLLFTTANSIIKCQDVVSLFKVGEGLAYNFWTREQCYVYSNEFTQDVNYNRAFTRIIQNLKQLRNIFDSKFVIATEQTTYGTIQYFTKTPIGVDTRPKFSSDIENENVQVGVNEFNIPQVINREISKIYEAFQSVGSFLTITDNRILTGINTGCSDPFCWSWKNMSCYNLTLPVIRICNINPITYSELKSNYPSDYVYAPSKTWGSAVAPCCIQVQSPI